MPSPHPTLATHPYPQTRYPALVLDLDSTLPFDAYRDAEFFAALPESPAIVRIDSRSEFSNARPFLIRTANLRSRMKRLLGRRDPSDPAAAKRLSLRDLASSITYRVAGSVF